MAIGRRILRLGVAALVAATSVSLSGCLSLTIRTHSVNKAVRAPHVQDATLDQLNNLLAAQYNALQTINASVEIKASTGGEQQGEVKVYPSFAGYILLRRPTDLRVLMLAPLVKSRAMDMVSDGTTFKLLIPPQNKAITGSDQEVATPATNGLYNLRPYIIRDALLIPPMQPDELVSETTNERILPPAKGKKDSTAEPDYDLTVTRVKSGREQQTVRELQTVRVIHISRVTLKPYEQDIYDAAGRPVTIVTYDKYQKFGDIDFPMSITITRPLDQYSLKINITKLILNQKLDDEQFVLKFPEGMTVTKM